MKTLYLFFLLSITVSNNIALAGYSDANGHIWTPDGDYINHGVGATASFDTSKHHGELSMGNACILKGKLTHPNKKKPIFMLSKITTDGIECPHVKTITIKILDGYAYHATGNASKIQISHPKQKSKISFSGVYKFSY